MKSLRIGTRAPIFGALFLLVFVGLAAAAAPAGAQVNECTRDGNQLSWSPTNVTVQVRGQVNAEQSRWIAAVSGANNNSYDLTAADLNRAPADSFFVRVRSGNEVTNVACTDSTNPIGPVGPGFCVQDGNVLTWGDIDGPLERNVFQVRRVNNDGSRTWLGSVDDASPHTFDVASASASYEIRYRITSAPGTTTVIDETCSSQPANEPPPADINCRQTEGLRWDAVDGLIGNYQVREFNADGSTSWVQSSSFNSAFPDFGDFSEGNFLIRYRIQDDAGNVVVIDSEICDNGQPAPDPDTPVTCTLDTFGFQTEYGYDVMVFNAIPGDSFTVFRNGVAGESALFPMPINDFANIGPNTYFRTNTNQAFVDVEIAPTGDLDARISCGSLATTNPAF